MRSSEDPFVLLTFPREKTFVFSKESSDRGTAMKDAESALNLVTYDATPMAVREMNNSSTLTRDNLRREPLSTVQVNRNATTTFSDWVKSVCTESLPLEWTWIKTGGESITIAYLQERKQDCTRNPMISKSITVNNNTSWSLRVLDRVVTNFDTSGCESLKKFQSIRAKDDLLKLVNVVHYSTICSGNPDIDVQRREYRRLPTETSFEVEMKDSSCYNSTIRSDQCSLLTHKKDRCNELSMFQIEQAFFKMLNISIN